MARDPMLVAQDTMSGKTTRQKVDDAERAAVMPRTGAAPQPVVRPKKKNLVKPKKKFVDARQKAIEAQQAADRAAIIERNKKMSLRSQP